MWDDGVVPVRRITGLSGVLVTTLLLSGCVKNTVLTSKDPNGSGEVLVIEYCSIADCFIGFADEAWSPELALVA